MKTLIIIPAREASTRLPDKMLADIGGKPLIAHTYEQAVSANIGDVVAACDGENIANAIKQAGGQAVITDPALPSGTDRVYAVWKDHYKGSDYDFIINLQGDLPFIDADFLRAADALARNHNYDITTLGAPIKDDSYQLNNVVKIAAALEDDSYGRALYFSRSPIPFGGPYYHHVGLYCFRAEALERFANLPQSRLEKIEKLEQLRALENGMSIGVAILDKPCPISVDTADDLEAARKYFASIEK